jgi:hypothetical protein
MLPSNIEEVTISVLERIMRLYKKVPDPDAYLLRTFPEGIDIRHIGLVFPNLLKAEEPLTELQEFLALVVQKVGIKE